MSEQKIQIVVDGTLVEGAAPDQVKQRVAQLFKTSPDKVEPMFSGKPVVVKKGLDLESARKYQAALKQAGLIAKITAMRAPAPASSPPQSSTATPTSNDIDTRSTPPRANVAPPDLSIAAAGETIMTHPPAQHVEIDTSHYQMEQVGETLDQTPRPTALNIDTSALTMAEAGATLMEHKSVPPAQIDTSNIKLAE